MKLSLNWIKDYVKIPEDTDLGRFAYDLTMSTVEVEGAERIRDSFEKIVVGRILEVLPHPNADKLRICKTDIGDGEIHDIVCGGSNLAPGMNVVVACPGAMVRWHGEGEPVEIKNAKLRGVPSFGMICASSEVGLADLLPAHEAAEIVDLSEFDAAPGTNVADALGIDDIILEIDNKSMTNRPDLWGHYGMAREIAALYDLELRPIAPYTAPEGLPEFPITISDTEKCPRYIGVKLEGMSVKPSPFELRTRLWRVGLRPINALVDVTNYVMLAVGQPTHAFDSDMIVDGINVRRASNGEELLLLNGKQLKLSPDDLVISDAKGAVALAGVMGGAKDSILPETSKVILEVANFESTGIRRTALKYDNRTDSSTRYEKAIDPQRCDLALSLAMELFGKLYPEMRVCAFKDLYVKPLACKQIDLSYSWLDRRLGKHISMEDISAKLGLLGFKVEFSGDDMHITVPSWRSTGDVSIKADIMEEVARMYGYENFEPTPITTSFTAAINQLDKALVRSIEEYLAYRCGMQEVLTYPWMQDSFVRSILGTTDGILALSTPPSPEERLIRCSTLPNLVSAVVRNERYFDDFSIFEEAQVYLDRDYSSPNDPIEKLPLQRRYLGCAFARRADKLEQVTALYRHVKGILSEMPRFTHMESFDFEKLEKPVWSDDTVWQNILVGGEVVGCFGLLSKKASLECGIKNLSVMLVELDLDAMKPLSSRTNSFSRLPEYPMTDYDLSLLVDTSVTWADIKRAVESKRGDLLRGVAFVDEYKGKQIPDGQKSVTIRLTLGSDTKTPTSEEIEATAKRVLKTLTKTIGASVRSN